MDFTEQGLIVGAELSPDLRTFLDQHQSVLQSTLRPYLALQFLPQTHLTPWQSKLGGTPYLPKDVDYPVGIDGRPLLFLAQLNFAEIPPLPQFPQTGILQFYIYTDDLFGANFDNLEERDNFAILYHATTTTDITELITDFSFLPEFDNAPLKGSAALSFTPKLAPVSVGDYRFEALLGEAFYQLPEPIQREYYDKLGYGQGHRLGGYPGFTQEDPRAWQEDYRVYDTLLLQLDSDNAENDVGERVELMWGDVGIANFFITSSALTQLDFSKMLFNWDCC